jgi:hypothetical protein
MHLQMKQEIRKLPIDKTKKKQTYEKKKEKLFICKLKTEEPKKRKRDNSKSKNAKTDGEYIDREIKKEKKR